MRSISKAVITASKYSRYDQSSSIRIVLLTVFSWSNLEHGVIKRLPSCTAHFCPIIGHSKKELGRKVLEVSHGLLASNPHAFLS